MKLKLLFLVLFSFECMSQIYDNSFNNGNVLYPQNIDNTTLETGIFSILNSDDKILTISNVLKNYINHTVINKYNADGTNDISFGTNGSLFLIDKKIINAKFINNKIRVFGSIGSDSLRFYLFQFNADGSIDTTFGTNGTIQLPVTFQFPNDNRTISYFNENNELYLLQYFFTNGLPSICKVQVTKFLNNYVLDSNFGTNGSTLYLNPASTYLNEPTGLTFLNDNKILISLGKFDKILKLNSNGLIDTTFGSNGILTFNHSVDYINKLADDSFYVIGTSGATCKLIKYNSDFTINTSFSTNGMFTFPADLYIINGFTNTENNIYVWGEKSGYWNCSIYKLNSNGFLDTTNGQNGEISLLLQNNITRVKKLFLSSDNKPIVFGNIRNSDNSYSQRFLFRMTDNFVLNNNNFLDNSVISIYPNPTKDYIYFNTNIDEINIYNLQGELIIKKKCDDNKYNVSNLEDGLYIIRFSSNNENYMSKFIKN